MFTRLFQSSSRHFTRGLGGKISSGSLKQALPKFAFSHGTLPEHLLNIWGQQCMCENRYRNNIPIQQTLKFLEQVAGRGELWNEQSHSCAMEIPDWDIGREKTGPEKLSKKWLWPGWGKSSRGRGEWDTRVPGWDDIKKNLSPVYSHLSIAGTFTNDYKSLMLVPEQGASIFLSSIKCTEN